MLFFNLMPSKLARNFKNYSPELWGRCKIWQILVLLFLFLNCKLLRVIQELIENLHRHSKSRFFFL